MGMSMGQDAGDILLMKDLEGIDMPESSLPTEHCPPDILSIGPNPEWGIVSLASQGALFM